MKSVATLAGKVELADDETFEYKTPSGTVTYKITRRFFDIFFNLTAIIKYFLVFYITLTSVSVAAYKPSLTETPTDSSGADVPVSDQIKCIFVPGEGG